MHDAMTFRWAMSIAANSVVVPLRLEWAFFYGLAQRQGLALKLYPTRAEAGPLREARKPLELDIDNPPSTDELLDLIFEGSRVPLSELRKHSGGAVFDQPGTLVAAKEAGWEGRLELAEPTMLAELADVRGEPVANGRALTPFA